MIIYGYILLQGANILAEGSEMLLAILHPGIIGGLVLPILGALPDSLIILVSGLGGEDPQKMKEEVNVGMGTLAGSTVMLLTIAYGGGILLGRADRNPRTGHMKEAKLTKPCDLVNTGVTVEQGMNINALVMLGTTILYLSVQGPAFFGITNEPLCAIIGAGLCAGGLLAYCVYQILSPSMQQRKIDAARRAAQRTAALSGISAMASQYGQLVTEDGQVDEDVLQQVFHAVDKDSSGRIDSSELRGLLAGMSLSASSQMSQLQQDVENMLKDLDADKGGDISEDEFKRGVKRWVQERVVALRKQGRSGGDLNQMLEEDSRREQQQQLLDEEAQAEAAESDDEEGDEEGEFDPGSGKRTATQIAIQAILLLVAGSFVCGMFADPMVEAVTTFSRTSHIPSFFVAFVITPLASNASELVSSLKFASRKRVKNITLTFGQVYGAVSMNNTMCLAVFLWVVYSNKLEWLYTAKVIGTVLPTIIVGIFGATGRNFRAIWALPILSLYPIALLTVWAIDTAMGTG